MLSNLDPVILARIQFAFTVSFHIVFPAFTIGLASWLAVVEWRYLKTGKDVYQEVYRMWVKIFAVTFGMGVVSGVVMSYQFGQRKTVKQQGNKCQIFCWIHRRSLSAMLLFILVQPSQ